MIIIFNLVVAQEDIESREIYKLMQHRLYEVYPEFDDIYSFLEICELYKIVSPSSLMNSLNKDSDEYRVVLMDREYRSPKFDSVIVKLHDMGFYVYHYDEVGRTVTLATYMDNIDCPNVDLMFGDLKVEKVALTPLNYRKISDPSSIKSLEHSTIYFFRIVAEGVLRKATDVRFSAFELQGKKRVYPLKFRIGNELVDINLFRVNEQLNKSMMEKILEEKSIFAGDQANTSKGVSFSISDPFSIGDLTLRVQINRTIAGYMCDTRIIKLRSIIDSSNSLGFPDKVNEVIDAMTRVQSGLCLVTGPMRSGKTTTLLAVFNEICKKPLGIAEISDPVESPLPLDAFRYTDVDGLIDITKSIKKLDLT